MTIPAIAPEEMQLHEVEARATSCEDLRCGMIIVVDGIEERENAQIITPQ